MAESQCFVECGTHLRLTEEGNLYAHTQNRLCMLIVPKSEAEILNSLKLLQDSQGNGQFTTDSQGHLQMSDDDSRTGTFDQTQPTKGDTACSVKGL